MLTAARASGWSVDLAPDQRKNSPTARAAVAAMYCTRPKLDHCTAPGSRHHKTPIRRHKTQISHSLLVIFGSSKAD